MPQENPNRPWWSPEKPTAPARITYNLRKRLLFALGGVFAVALLMGAAFSSPQERSRQISFGIVENPPSLDALVATCTGIVEWRNPADVLTRLPWNAEDGPAEAQVARALARDVSVRPGFYPKDDKNIPSTEDIASYLGKGGIVAWYATDPGSETAVGGLESVLSVLAEDGVEIVAMPWPADKMSRMPTFSRTSSGGRLLYMKLGAVQSCAVASDVVIEKFSAST